MESNPNINPDRIAEIENYLNLLFFFNNDLCYFTHRCLKIHSNLLIRVTGTVDA